MNQIDKVLTKLSRKERASVVSVLEKLRKGDAGHLDIKKLKGREDIFRVRKGTIRIIYRKINEQIVLLDIGRRNENIYKNF